MKGFFSEKKLNEKSFNEWEEFTPSSFFEK